jgi:hypothetical protein
LQRKKDARSGCQHLFFLARKLAKQKVFVFKMVENCQHQHKGRPRAHEKSQGASISVEDAIKIFRGLNLRGAHCSKHLNIIVQLFQGPGG